MRYRFVYLCLLIGLSGVYGYCYFAAARKSPRPGVPATRVDATRMKTTAPRVVKAKPDGFDPAKAVLNEKEDIFKKALVLPLAPVPNP
jgi:hypothetical protein